MRPKAFCPGLKSAYEAKNDCCLFERLFKVKKNDVFLFGISFFLLKIFTFLIMQMRKVLMSYIIPVNQLNSVSRISQEILEHCSSSLASEIYKEE